MCARNQAQADKHQGLFRQDAFRGREDNTQELSHDHDTVLGECVVSGIRHLVFDKKKILRGSKGTGQSNVTSSFGKTGIGPFFFLKSKLTRCGQMSTKKSSALGVAVPWMKGVRKFCKRTV